MSTNRRHCPYCGKPRAGSRVMHECLVARTCQQCDKALNRYNKTKFCIACRAAGYGAKRKNHEEKLAVKNGLKRYYEDNAPGQ